MRKLTLIMLTLAVAISLGGGSALAKPGKEHRNTMASPVHQEMYMVLLAERYTPESVAAWKKVFEERQALMEQVKKQDEAKREHFRTEMRRIYHDGNGKMQEHMETMKQFTRAIESGDDKLIREVLPKLLASEQNLNKILADALRTASKKK